MTCMRAALILGLGVAAQPDDAGGPKSGLKSIDKRDVAAHLRYLASPTLVVTAPKASPVNFLPSSRSRIAPMLCLRATPGVSPRREHVDKDADRR